MPALLFMAAVYGYPALNLLAQSFDAPHWSFAFYDETFEPPFATLVTRTFMVSAQVTALCVVFGYPLAYAMLKSSARWRKIIILAVVLPLWTSALVRNFAWIVILNQEGILNHALRAVGLINQPLKLLFTRFAVLIGFLHVMLPFFVFPLYGVMTRLDLRLVDAARSMGAGRARAFLAVFLPLSLPGVAAGMILIFVLCLGYYITPALLGGLGETTFVMMIANEVTVGLHWQLASAMAVVLLLLTIIPVLLFGRLLGFSAGGTQQRHRPSWAGTLMVRLATLFPPRRGAGPAPAMRPARQGLGPGLTIYVVLMFVFLLLPLLLLIPLSLGASSYLEFPPSHWSLRWVVNFFTSRTWIGPTLASLEVAFCTSVAATALGTLTAVGLSRSTSRWVNVALAFVLSPLVVPHLIIAIGVYFEFVQLRLNDTLVGLFLAHTVIALPLVVTIILGALRNADLMPERAARSLGANPFRAFWRTTLVALKPSIISAALFAFLASFDDVVMALFICGVNVSTLPKRIWDSIVFEIDPSIAAASVSLMAVSVTLFIAVQFFGKGGLDGVKARH